MVEKGKYMGGVVFFGCEQLGIEAPVLEMQD